MVGRRRTPLAHRTRLERPRPRPRLTSLNPKHTRGRLVLVSPVFGETEPALSEPKGPGRRPSQSRRQMFAVLCSCPAPAAATPMPPDNPHTYTDPDVLASQVKVSEPSSVSLATAHPRESDTTHPQESHKPQRNRPSSACKACCAS